ncbi:MBL fold metallo-hydrolase [Halomarina litorea]|uniref:MBL fold metallo-hydrolase n=1 Tax=Halomarina litorea TaxID=2961595 RepID=UPI0020C2EDAD|nr:MBL fold metallo-hydrolase [Halomarina sp. BCD28]
MTSDVTELAAGVYDITCVRRAEGRIRAFLVDADSPTLFDAGLPDTADTLVEGIESTGVTPEQVAVTHADFDHVGGADAVCDAFDADLLVPEGSDPDVETTPTFYGAGETVAGFEAVHVPGHRGHQHAWVNEERGVAVLADAVSGADQRGLPQGYFHLPPAKYTDDLNLAEENLAAFREYDFEVGLVYHGSSVLDGASETLHEYAAIVE